MNIVSPEVATARAAVIVVWVPLAAEELTMNFAGP
jgi:hypothetical protein